MSFADPIITKSRLAFENRFLHIQDQKASGVNGGTKNAATWDTRILNTVATNQISGASLLSNLITLPAGSYHIEAKAPVYLVNGNKLRLYNTTDSIAVLHGLSNHSNDIGVYNFALLSGRFTLGATKQLRLDHYSVNSRATNGLGIATGDGSVEKYTDIKIWKVA